MKSTAFRNTLFSLPALGIAAALSLLSVPSAFSATVFTDNFNSYADDGALLAMWSRVTGTSSSIFLAPDPVDPANQTIEQTLAAGRLRHVLANGVVPTLGEPLVFSFDLYDVGGSGRQFGEIRNSAAVTGLLAAGIYNSSTIGTFDATRYSARNLDGGGWLSLNAARSVGWHNFRFELMPGRAELYVDGVLEPAFSALAYTGAPYDWVHVGSGLTSGAAIAYYDNVSVFTVPEPSAAALTLLGLAALLGRKSLRRS